MTVNVRIPKCAPFRYAQFKTFIAALASLSLVAAAIQSRAADVAPSNANLSLAATSQQPRLSADGTLDLSEWKGKVVYLDFWASWCGPCRQSFPWMMHMQRHYADQGFVVVGVNVDKDRELARQFLDQFGATFPIIYDSSGHLAEQYKVAAMPSSMIFDRNGKLRFVHKGFRSDQTSAVEGELKSLLK